MNLRWMKSHKILSSWFLVLFIIALISASNSLILSWTLNNWLKSHASDVSLQSLKLSLLNSQLEIEGLSAKDKKGHEFTIKAVKVSWDFSDLWDKHLSITQLSIDGLILDIRGDAFQPKFIGPIELASMFNSDDTKSTVDEDSSWTFTVGNIDIDNTRLCYQDKNIENFTQDIDLCSSWNALQLNTTLKLDINKKYQYNGDININKFSIADKQKAELLSFSELSLTDLSLLPDQLAINEFAINGFKLLPLKADDKQSTAEYLTELELVEFSQLNLTEQELALESISIVGLSSYITLGNEGLNILKWKKYFIPPNTEVNDKTANINVQKTFAIKLDDIEILGGSNIIFVDQLYENHVVHHFNDIRLQIKDFQLGKPSKEPSAATFSVKIEDSGAFNGEGSFNISDNSLDLNLTGNTNNVDLVKLTNHSEKMSGYRIDQGQLNVGYEIKLEENLIDANFDVTLEKFELGKLQEHEKSTTNETLGIPLPLALNLLRDSDNNIAITLPVTGDIRSPDFSLSNVFSIVTMKAIKNAVIYYYSPLGLFDIASGIVNLATALNFDPVIFDTGSIELSEQAKIQLTKISKIMLEKPNVKFVICANATMSDIEMTSSKTEISETEKVDLKPLIELANKRQGMIIAHLTKNGVVEASRLIACNVKLDKNPKAKAQVNISI